MAWIQKMFKFNWKMSKDKWLLLLLAAGVLLVVAIPSGNSPKKSAKTEPAPTAAAVSAAADSDGSYEKQLENRVKEILKNVSGVGKVDVMIVLKSSEEKILRVDRDTTSSVTEESDSAGGSRKIKNEEAKESTVLSGSGSENGPIVEKELKPEIAGIVISAEGGASPTVKAEISSAMEALFDLPPHKIKVLKRVE